MAKKSSSRRYAQALFQIGAEEDNVKILLEDMEKVNESLKEEKLVYLLDSPKLKISEKVKLIDDIFRKKIDESILKLLYVLAENKDFKYFSSIYNSYKLMVYDSLQIEIAEIITAVKLDQKSINNIKSKLENSINKKIEVSTSVDPALIAGFVAKIGDRILDASAKSSLIKMDRMIKN
ncbi:MAG: ATP synthase F1 subunit delta [Chloroflexi bacterium]|nr:ATP synthase F1 subunit delta [Chloroflexota bacterium]|tara:strand:+ start:40325 stop:40858 length:534 start_codon:yes stop_codon:yes gene_type:complete